MRENGSTGYRFQLSANVSVTQSFELVLVYRSEQISTSLIHAEAVQPSPKKGLAPIGMQIYICCRFPSHAAVN